MGCGQYTRLGVIQSVLYSECGTENHAKSQVENNCIFSEVSMRSILLRICPRALTGTGTGTSAANATNGCQRASGEGSHQNNMRKWHVCMKSHDVISNTPHYSKFRIP